MFLWINPDKVNNVMYFLMAQRLWTYSDEITDEIHLLEKQADNNETGVVSEFLDHQIRPARNRHSESQHQKKINYKKSWLIKQHISLLNPLSSKIYRFSLMIHFSNPIGLQIQNLSERYYIYYIYSYFNPFATGDAYMRQLFHCLQL